MDYQHDERQPSQAADDDWLLARRRNDDSPYVTNGKWLIYAKQEKIDTIWKIIALATEEGYLGCFSKVSTVGLTFTAQTGVHAVCIYTYNSSDQNDVMRVRAMLRELGVTSPISYVTWNNSQEQTTLYKE